VRRPIAVERIVLGWLRQFAPACVGVLLALRWQRPAILPVRLPDSSQIIRYLIWHEAIIPSGGRGPEAASTTFSSAACRSLCRRRGSPCRWLAENAGAGGSQPLMLSAHVAYLEPDLHGVSRRRASRGPGSGGSNCWNSRLPLVSIA
jgi:hypothetical protein